MVNYESIPENLIESIVKSNSTRKDYIASRIFEFAKNINIQGQCTKKQPVVGIFRLTMKSNSDNFRQSAILGVMERLKSMGTLIIVCEPMLTSGDLFENCLVVNDLNVFKSRSDCIVVNRFSSLLNDARNKIYTRDVFSRD